MEDRESGRGSNGFRLRVLGISGSLRKASFNTALLRAAQELAPEGMEVSIFDIKSIPFYDADVEAQGDPQPVAELKSAIRSADGVLFATPEYNFGIPGVLKNAIDWASRDKAEGSLIGKPVAMMGAGGVAGTARAQIQLLYILSETGALVMAKPRVLVTMARQKFSSEGRLTDEQSLTALRLHLEEFARWVLRVGRPLKSPVAQG